MGNANVSWEAGSPFLSGLMIEYIWNDVAEYKISMHPKYFVYNDCF